MKKKKSITGIILVLLLCLMGFRGSALAAPLSELLPGAGAAGAVFGERDLSRLIAEARQKQEQKPAVQESAVQEEAASGEEVPAVEETPREEPAAPETEPAKTEETVQEVAPVQESAPQPAKASGGGRIVCIDAGHQLRQNSAKEPNGPGSSEMKMKVTSGTRGVSSGVPEYQLTLDVALRLQSVLSGRGYTVVMCRTTNEVDISNAERAAVANNAGAGAFIRIHADGASSASASGASTLAPSDSNPYCAGIAPQSQALARCVINGLCARTGAKNRGVTITDTMTGLNWSQVPVTIVEMGFMTNPAEDMAMQDPAYQQKLAEGMADGIDAFFGS